jgi:hypothetical protein
LNVKVIANGSKVLLALKTPLNLPLTGETFLRKKLFLQQRPSSLTRNYNFTSISPATKVLLLCLIVPALVLATMPIHKKM